MDNFARTITAIGLGNALEWFDFAIFGALADIIGFHFFPAKEESSALMASFSIYCSAFFMRPLGGILMGYIGDRYSRKRALEISIALMMIPSFLIGLLPTYDQIGFFATIILVFLRLLQGLAVGGEMIGAYIFTIEACEGKRNRGLWGGICKSTALCGTAFGMGFVAVQREVMTEDTLYRYGWRIPFLFSIVLGSIAGYLRYYIKESDEFEKAKIKPPTTQVNALSNLMHVIRIHWPEIIYVIFVGAFWCVCYYIAFVWMGYYTSNLIGGKPVQHAWIINFIFILILIAVMPIGGALGDFAHDVFQHDKGYRYVMIFACGFMVIVSGPAFALIRYKELWAVCLGQLLLTISVGLFGGCLAVFMVSQFAVEYRYSALGIAYNTSTALFAGTAPIIQTALVMKLRNMKEHHELPTHSYMFLALYIMFIAIISGLFLLVGPTIISFIRKKYSLVVTEKFSFDGSGIDDSVTSSRNSGDSVKSNPLDTSTTPMMEMIPNGSSSRSTQSTTVNREQQQQQQPVSNPLNHVLPNEV